MTALAVTPPNVGLFICDLPTYYAVGDSELVLLFRNMSLMDAVPHDEQVQAHLTSYPALRLVGRSYHENPNPPRDKLTALMYAASDDEIPKARLAELIDPLRRASDNALSRYVRSVLA